MKSYTRVLRMARETPWAILPEKLMEVRAFLAAKAGLADGPDPDADAGRPDTAAAAARRGPAVSGDVAVLPLTGVLGQRMDPLLDISGGTSTDRFRREFLSLVNDDRIGAVVLDVDSPGGSVFGVEELSLDIFRARGAKPIIAAVNSLAASAAYWIASAAGEVVVTPGGLAGSIGVFALHEDLSAWLEREGVKVSLISAGKFKTEGNEFEPLADEARAAIQAEVDRYYAMFTAAVARNRGVKPAAVREGFGQGRLVGAQDAVRQGMADRVASLPEVLERLAGRPARRASAAAETRKPLDRRARELQILEE